MHVSTNEGIEMTTLQEGDRAPSFALPADDGSTVALSDFVGRPLVIYFCPQDDTETCTAEAIAFSALSPAFGEAGAGIVGISPDSAKKHGKFKAKHGLSLRLAADEARQAIEAYGVWGEKTTFGRTYMGVERTTFLIDGRGRIARIWRKVRVNGHAEEVLAAVRSLA